MSENSNLDHFVGQILEGKYQITKKIGQGGMATVYAAYDDRFNREVAVKILPARFSHDTTFVERFEREVKIIANLTHPRVLPVYDFGYTDSIPYIVMALMTGGTLSDLLKAQTQTNTFFDLDEAAYYIEAIAEGIEFLHRRGIIHRDFKPSNVLLNEAQEPYLADFGIAKVQEGTVDLTGERTVGTPFYMAPEMWRGGTTLDQTVDIYAMGVALFQMLAGRLPYKGEIANVMYAHLHKPVPDVRDANLDLPGSIQRVIHTAMAKSPEHRYQSARVMAEALNHAIAQPEGPPHAADLVEPPPVQAPAQPQSIIQRTYGPEEATVDQKIQIVGSSTSTIPSSEVAAPRRRRIGLITAIVAVLLLAGGGLAFATGLVGGAGNADLTATALALAEVEVIPTNTPFPTETPTVAPTDEPALVPVVDEVPTATPLPDIPGGGTGIITFDASGGQAFAVDAGCILLGVEESCPPPQNLNELNPDLTALGIQLTDGRWSPDGQYMAYAADVGLVITDPDGSNARFITEAAVQDSAWSPDGSSLAFASGDSIWAADMPCVLGGGNECATQISPDNFQVDSDPHWLPDGLLLSFLERQPSTFDLVFTINPEDTTDVTQVSPPNGTVTGFAWLDTTRLLYVETARSGGTGGTVFFDIGLNLITVGEENGVRVVDFSVGNYGTDCDQGLCPGGGSFDLSPDGSRLVISLAPDAQNDLELFQLDLACLDQLAEDEQACNKALAQLTDNSVDDLLPTWSPDGTLVALIRASSTKLTAGLDDTLRNLAPDVFVLDPEAADGGVNISNLGHVMPGTVPRWQP